LPQALVWFFFFGRWLDNWQTEGGWGALGAGDSAALVAWGGAGLGVDGAAEDGAAALWEEGPVQVAWGGAGLGVDGVAEDGAAALWEEGHALAAFG